MNIAIKGGGRNRARRSRRAERTARRYPCIALAHEYVRPAKLVPVDLSGTWTPEIARVALTEHVCSGKSQKAFAQERGFPVGRLNTWRKRLEA